METLRYTKDIVIKDWSKLIEIQSTQIIAVFFGMFRKFFGLLDRLVSYLAQNETMASTYVPAARLIGRDHFFSRQFITETEHGNILKEFTEQLNRLQK